MTTPSSPARARELGIPLSGQPGPHNAITDVYDVEVGYVTLIEGDGPLRVGSGPVRTGVTAVLPRGRQGVDRVCAAGWSTLNGNGEMTGTTWIQEAGTLRSPILISNTHAIGACHQGAVAWMVEHHPRIASQWLLPVVAETWDGYLNDINGGHVRPEHAIAAIEGAGPGPVAEGSVGGGTGMTCYGFKGGSGTASRSVEVAGVRHTVGVFVQANFGRRDELVIAGTPIGRGLPDDDPESDPGWLAPPGAGSVIVVIATDTPLLPGQCQALARRAPIGLARTGTSGSHYSGDIFLALSTADADGLASRLTPPTPALDGGHGPQSPYASITFVAWEHIDPLYEAVAQATEEAVLNALVAAETMIGRDGHRSPALPTAALGELLARARSARRAPADRRVTLRPLAESDLDSLFDWERDPRAVAMAAFTRADPSDRAEFDAHHRRVRNEPSATTYAIDDRDGLVGTIASFTLEDEREVSYWIDPARWGQGLASAALAALLAVEATRPLFGRVAEHNAGSAKVLTRAGFVRVGSERSYAPGIGSEVVEHIYRLDG